MLPAPQIIQIEILSRLEASYIGTYLITDNIKRVMKSVKLSIKQDINVLYPPCVAGNLYTLNASAMPTTY